MTAMRSPSPHACLSGYGYESARVRNVQYSSIYCIQCPIIHIKLQDIVVASKLCKLQLSFGLNFWSKKKKLQIWMSAEKGVVGAGLTAAS